MTSPVEQIEVRCPRCGETYKTYHRGSFNLDLGEEYDDAYVGSVTTATCPACRHVVELAALAVEHEAATARLLPDGRILAPMRTEGEGAIGDGLVPIAPGHPDYGRWKTWLEREEER